MSTPLVAVTLASHSLSDPTTDHSSHRPCQPHSSPSHWPDTHSQTLQQTTRVTGHVNPTRHRHTRLTLTLRPYNRPLESLAMSTPLVTVTLASHSLSDPTTDHSSHRPCQPHSSPSHSPHTHSQTLQQTTGVTGHVNPTRHRHTGLTLTLRPYNRPLESPAMSTPLVTVTLASHSLSDPTTDHSSHWPCQPHSSPSHSPHTHSQTLQQTTRVTGHVNLTRHRHTGLTLTLRPYNRPLESPAMSTPLVTVTLASHSLSDPTTDHSSHRPCQPHSSPSHSPHTHSQTLQQTTRVTGHVNPTHHRHTRLTLTLRPYNRPLESLAMSTPLVTVTLASHSLSDPTTDHSSHRPCQPHSSPSHWPHTHSQTLQQTTRVTGHVNPTRHRHTGLTLTLRPYNRPLESPAMSTPLVTVTLASHSLSDPTTDHSSHWPCQPHSSPSHSPHTHSQTLQQTTRVTGHVNPTRHHHTRLTLTLRPYKIRITEIAEPKCSYES